MHHLMGVTEIAEMLGVSRQRVHKIIQDDKRFPTPVAVLEHESRRIWRTADIERWAQQVGRL